MAVTLKDFEGRVEDIERIGRGIEDSWRGFFYLRQVAAVAAEKLIKENNNGTRNAISSFESSKLKRKRSSKNQPEANLPPDMPQEFKNRIQEMGGTVVELIIQKPLYKTDLKKGQGRMSIPANQIQCQNFLTDEEEELLNRPDERGKLKAIETKVIGPNVTEGATNMNFKKWDMRGSSLYVLTTKWNSLVASNRSTLKVGNTIQLWSFRQGGQLCFALVVLGPARGADGGES